MATNDLRDDELWPIPPPWLMACDECTRLYQRMIAVREAVAEAELASAPGVDYDPFDSGLSAQLALAQHMASEHVELLPDFEAACPQCRTCREDLERPAMSDRTAGWAIIKAAEHRARHLIVPPVMTERL
ncbi:hypothetical protein ABZS76_27290 [Streptomyces sp. NPDC005562]|uniref:hypothetical protein n=1 Tax=unclassified Streptomyces TaxID=2593676 RepID=UPI0033AD8058